MTRGELLAFLVGAQVFALLTALGLGLSLGGVVCLGACLAVCLFMYVRHVRARRREQDRVHVLLTRPGTGLSLGYDGGPDGTWRMRDASIVAPEDTP